MTISELIGFLVMTLVVFVLGGKKEGNKHPSKEGVSPFDLREQKQVLKDFLKTLKEEEVKEPFFPSVSPKKKEEVSSFSGHVISKKKILPKQALASYSRPIKQKDKNHVHAKVEKAYLSEANYQTIRLGKKSRGQELFSEIKDWKSQFLMQTILSKPKAIEPHDTLFDNFK